MPQQNRQRHGIEKYCEAARRQRYHDTRCARNALRRLQESFRIPQDVALRRTLLRGMTNWQNSQWLRAGRSTELKTIRKFALLPRRAA